ncbi:MAG: (d)CMP kinase [Actinomycetaceae bacterium]|nr:(d)CMP kinase [Actinomycetaceae bacterium]MDU0969518.1 (d)CMP kinase [Actinomycetaceae bacterium]
MGRGLIIAIDGPAGSGKSSVSRTVGADLYLDYLDTGAMYRALTWWLLETGVDLEDRDALAEAAKALPLEMGLSPHNPFFVVDNRNVTRLIRGPEVTSAVSKVAAHPDVRAALIDKQRAYIQAARDSGKGMIVEGRDTTTVVAPNADLRILLTASAAERERRRAAEAGDETARTMAQRDALDSTVNNFTTPAEGVVLIDSDKLTLSQTVNAVLDLVRGLL